MGKMEIAEADVSCRNGNCKHRPGGREDKDGLSDR